MTPQDMASTHAAAFQQARPWSADEFAHLLANRFTHYIGTPQCFAVFQVIADEAELLTLATHPSQQRQGLASLCMKNWQDRAVELGATRAFLEVAADNHPALNLYLGCAYQRCGVRNGYYTRENAENADAIVMERTLP